MEGTTQAKTPAHELSSLLNQAVVSTPPGAARKKFEPHDFPGYGSSAIHSTPSHDRLLSITTSLEDNKSSQTLLTELEATSISGNDILSSAFYVSGLVTLSAGKLAPFCLFLVALVLYLFRGIYHESVTALPCNGGTYNILLNATSKQVASIAAVFAIIAYITTGVVSALTAIAYLQTVLPDDAINLQTATILLLGFFCALTNLGMSESATFAKVVFVTHVCTLTILVLFGVLFMFENTEQLLDNWSTPYPSIDAPLSIDDDYVIDGSFFTAVFYGFSSAMLGVSGFETSSQFIEEQAPGVFPKTLRNMWAGVILFNPLLSLISFAALPVHAICENKDTVLAGTAHVVGQWVHKKLHFPEHVEFGKILSVWVSIDAFIVLSGAVLTSYVGINGLIRRMSMDRCLPQFFLSRNRFTGTDSFILVGFFVLCVSQVILLDSDVEALGGVYCYAFLSVMTIFAFGNILLKVKRPSLPREVTVSYTQSVVGLVAVIIALMGNVLGKPELLVYFFVYFLIIGTLVLVMFKRVALGRLLYRILKAKRGLGLSGWLSGYLKDVQDVPFVFFIKHDDVHLLNKAVLYIQNNEQTSRLVIVHCCNETDAKSLGEHVKLVDLLYPKVKISLLLVEAEFGVGSVEWLSQELRVPVNAMFISCPDEDFSMKVSQLRGMRIITSF